MQTLTEVVKDNVQVEVRHPERGRVFVVWKDGLLYIDVEDVEDENKTVIFVNNTEWDIS